jgi:death-on-curing protein
LRHYRVTIEDLIEAHAHALEHGGLAGIRDSNLLASAIGRPYVGYNRSIHAKAAALVQSLATNHGFVDGNKRTAFLIADLFLNRSGYVLHGVRKSGLHELEDLILAVVEQHLSADDIAAWFRRRVRRKP